MKQTGKQIKNTGVKTFPRPPHGHLFHAVPDSSNVHEKNLKIAQAFWTGTSRRTQQSSPARR